MFSFKRQVDKVAFSSIVIKILIPIFRLWERSEELVVLEEEEAKRREEEAKLALQSSEVNADQVIAGVNPDQEEATLAQVDIEQVLNYKQIEKKQYYF